ATVLAVQRQMERELVDRHAGQETDVGPAAVNDAGGCRRARQDLGVAPLDARAHVFQDHVGAGPLRQAVADLLTDDFKVGLIKAGDFGVRYGNHLDGNLRLIEEWHRLVATLARNLRFGFTLMRRHAALPAGQRLVWEVAEVLAQGTLDRIRRGNAAFALLAEDLALEPRELATQLNDFLVFVVQ